MKKILLLACFGLFLVNGLFAQEIDFKYKVDSTLTNPKQYSITVTVTKGTGPFNIYLYEGLPWKGGILSQSRIDQKESAFVFKNILPGKLYLLSVELKNNEEAVVRRSLRIK